MTRKIKYIISVLIISVILFIPGAFGNKNKIDNLYTQNAETQQIRDKENPDSDETFQGTYDLLIEKAKKMKEEYQVLKKEREQLNSELQKFNKKRKGHRSSRSLGEVKLLRQKKKDLNKKLMDFSKRQKALNGQIEKYNNNFEQE